MTSEERREARYQRRKAKREAKALETTGKSFDEVINFGNMVEAGRKCCDGSRWKTSTILFETHLLPEWSQPLGAHDAYSKGAKVSHNGKHWISDLDANVWEPGQYGWTEAPAEAQEE